jgi:hypothetical protein
MRALRAQNTMQGMRERSIKILECRDHQQRATGSVLVIL